MGLKKTLCDTWGTVQPHSEAWAVPVAHKGKALWCLGSSVTAEALGRTLAHRYHVKCNLAFLGYYA